jgi:hypothetical protein
MKKKTKKVVDYKSCPSKKELLKSPTRKWDGSDMHIAVIGVTRVNGQKEYEIAAYPDDISTFFPKVPEVSFNCALVRMDCYYPSGVLQYHGRGKFKVSDALSSIDITFEPDKPNL